MRERSIGETSVMGSVSRHALTVLRGDHLASNWSFFPTQSIKATYGVKDTTGFVLSIIVGTIGSGERTITAFERCTARDRGVNRQAGVLHDYRTPQCTAHEDSDSDSDSDSEEGRRTNFL